MSVPIQLPETLFVLQLLQATPEPVLPEMMFRSPGLVPPMVLLFTLWPKEMPAPFARAERPFAVVPIRLPRTVKPFPLLIDMPPPFPEMTLPGGVPGVAVDPPIWVPPVIPPWLKRMPDPELGMADVPAGVV